MSPASIGLAVVIGTVGAFWLVYAGVMVDRALRGYQDSDDIVYLGVAAASFCAFLICAALVVIIVRLGRKSAL